MIVVNARAKAMDRRERRTYGLRNWCRGLVHFNVVNLANEQALGFERRAIRSRSWQSVLVQVVSAARLCRHPGIAWNSSAACRTSRAGETRGQYRGRNQDLRIS